jgi:hypothetical protein
MFSNRKFLLIISFLFIFLWSFPSFGAVIEGPVLNLAEKGWSDFGLVIHAEADVMLVSVRFPNQGLADVIQLRKSSTSALLASIPVPAGNQNAIVNLNYPLTANETYLLVATTPNNKYAGPLGTFGFPSADPDITILSSYLGYPYYGYWFSFNDITTQQKITELEAVIDIKPGSDRNSINLKAKGVIPVAILTTEDFDALSVDAHSVLFAGAPAVRFNIEDVNGDGNYDMFLFFNTADLRELTSVSTVAVLTGTTVDGTPFTGADVVQIVPAK